MLTITRKIPDSLIFLELFFVPICNSFFMTFQFFRFRHCECVLFYLNYANPHYCNCKFFFTFYHTFLWARIYLSFFVWDSRKFIHKDLIKSQEEKPAKIIFFLCYDNLEKNEVFCARVKNNRKIFMEMSNKIILFVILSCFLSLRGFYHIKKGFSFWFVILG